MVLAKDIFKEFREHSVSEFFRKNAAMLGYTGKIRSLTTVVHEGVTNAIDAAEDAGRLPSVFVAIREMDDSNHYKVVIEDNASGIPDEYIPRVFGRMLAGTKMHRNVQNRGQQGIGISGGVMFSQSTSGQPTKVYTSTEDMDEISYNEVMIDVDKNRGDILDHKVFEGDWRGTRSEFEVKEVIYQKSRYGPYNYLRMTAIANPHVQITFEEPDGSLTIFERATDEVPEEPEPIPPHPGGMKADGLLDLANDTNSRSVGTFLVSDLSRFSRNKLEELEDMVEVDLDKDPEKLSWSDSEKIVSAFRKMDFISPPTNGLRPVGEEDIQRGLEQILDPDFACAVTRSPEVCRGGIPFIIETGLAYGGNAGDRTGSGNGLELIRFGNRAPLIFNQGGCALTLAARDIDWKRYEIDPDKTPVTLFINIVSTHVPYTSAGKQSVAEEPEVYEEVRQAIMQAARKLKKFLKKRIKKKEKRERANLFEDYLPIVLWKASDLAEIDHPYRLFRLESEEVVEDLGNGDVPEKLVEKLENKGIGFENTTLESEGDDRWDIVSRKPILCLEGGQLLNSLEDGKLVKEAEDALKENDINLGKYSIKKDGGEWRVLVGDSARAYIWGEDDRLTVYKPEIKSVIMTEDENVSVYSPGLDSYIRTIAGVKNG